MILYLGVFDVDLLVVMLRNVGSWSDMPAIKTHESYVIFIDFSLVKMRSYSLQLPLLSLVGVVICGSRLCEVIASKYS